MSYMFANPNGISYVGGIPMTGFMPYTLPLNPSKLAAIELSESAVKSADALRKSMDEAAQKVHKLENELADNYASLYSSARKVLTIRSENGIANWFQNLYMPSMGVLSTSLVQDPLSRFANAALVQLMLPSCPACKAFVNPLESALSALGLPAGMAIAIDVSCLRDPACTLAKFINDHFRTPLSTTGLPLWDGLVPALFGMRIIDDYISFVPISVDRNASVEKLKRDIEDALTINRVAGTVKSLDMIQDAARLQRDAREHTRIQDTVKDLSKIKDLAESITPGPAKNNLESLIKALQAIDEGDGSITKSTALESELAKLKLQESLDNSRSILARATLPAIQAAIGNPRIISDYADLLRQYTY